MELRDSYQKYQKKKEYNNKMIEKTVGQISEIKKELRSYKESHKTFLLELLKRGKDFR